MAIVYVSYSRKDRDFVVAVTAQLSEVGHQILIDDEILEPGVDWRSALKAGMRKADVFLVFLSENSVKSPYVIEELVSARARTEVSADVLLIPMIIDSIPIPEVINDLFAYTEPHREIKRTAQIIQNAIAKFQVKKDEREKNLNESMKAAEAASERLESNASVYIEEAIESLKLVEARYRAISNRWYVAGFGALLLGVLVGVLGLLQWTESGKREWVDFALVTLKTLVILSLLGACAKYAFSLGRSYVSEALKNADRIHAISFGKFYLRAFGSRVEWSQLKEVFQHWNIDRASSFNSSSSADFDPRILERLNDLAKTVTSKADK